MKYKDTYGAIHWWIKRNSQKTGKCCNFGKQKKIRMHKEIMQTPEGMETDHINGDTLDNRRSKRLGFMVSTPQLTKY